MNDLLVKIKNLFLYGGLTKTGFKEITPLLDEENFYMLEWVSGTGALIGAVMLGLTALGMIRRCALPGYIVLTVCSSLIFLITVFWLSKNKRYTGYFLLMELSVILLYAIFIGTVVTETPDSFAVSFSAFIVLVPFLIAGPPMPVMLLIAAADLLVFLVTPYYKNSHAAFMDCLNAVTFSIIGFGVLVAYSNRNMRRLASEYFIAMDHSLDELTGLQNKRAFRAMVDTYLSRRISGEEGALLLIRMDYGSQELAPEDRNKERITIAQSLRMMTSRHELAGRIEPDLFAVFFRECSKTEAAAQRSRIEEALSKRSLQCRQVLCIVQTEERDTFETLLERGYAQLDTEKK